MKGAAGTVSQAIATPKIRRLKYLTVQAYRYAINCISHSKTYNSITVMKITNTTSNDNDTDQGVCVCMCVCMCPYMRVYVHVCAVYVHTCVRACVCVCVPELAYSIIYLVVLNGIHCSS